MGSAESEELKSRFATTVTRDGNAMQHIFIKAVGSMPESDLGVARLGAYMRRAFAAAAPVAGEAGTLSAPHAR
jgi:hypothetical protein